MASHLPVTLEIRLLGGFYIVYQDKPLTKLDRPRLQALLAYLLLHRAAPLSRQHLAFLFWPDTSEKQARTNLRNLLHKLRQALPDADQFLHISPTSVQWRDDAPVTLDVAQFENALIAARRAESDGNQAGLQTALKRALALYQGDLVPDLYDDWSLEDRERLRNLLAGALKRLVELLEQRRDYTAALRYGQRLLRHDPLREETYRLLMRLHALNGDRPAALRAYHVCTTILQRELGVEPSPATQRAYQRLLKLADQPGTRPAPPLAEAVSLVGRQSEWRRLDQAWQRARRGHPQLVLISGEVGIGKTRLAQELVDKASRQGIATASARSYAPQGAMAYAPVAEWLRSAALRPALAGQEDVWLSEVARLLPELLAERPDLARPGPLQEGWQQQRFFQALAQAVLGGTQPLLLHLDDLQWCDGETLAWLDFLLHYDQRARLLVVATARSEEVHSDHPLSVWLHALRPAGLLTEIELGPLDAADTAALAAHVAGHDLTPAQAEHLYAETEGNPLFVVEMVRAALGQGDKGARGQGEVDRPTSHPATPSPPHLVTPSPLPPKVQAVIEARLAQLSAEARDLLNLAAVIGHEFSYPVLAAACGVDENTLMLGLDELWQRRIVREQGNDAYDFSHDKLREVAYAGLSALRRHLLHRRVAEALEKVHSIGSRQEMAAILAHHHLQAGNHAQAVDYLLLAGDQQRALHALDKAAQFYRLAATLLQEQEKDDLAARALLRLGLTHTAAFQPAQAQHAFDQAFVLWEPEPPSEARSGPEVAPAVLSVAVGEPVSLDPARAYDFDACFLLDQLFEGLVAFDAERNILPAAAVRWEVAENGTRYLFYLRETSRWSDGTPLTAADFEYAWKRNLAPQTQAPAAHLLWDIHNARAFSAGQLDDAEQVGVRALGEHVLEVRLESPSAYFPYLLAHPITYPLPRRVVEARPEQWTGGESLVTNGAYRLEEWQRGQHMTLAANRFYRGRFPGNVQRIRCPLYHDWKPALQAYAADEIDVLDMAGAGPASLAQARRDHRDDLVTTPMPGTHYLIFRADRPPFDDDRIRRAFVHAVDRDTLMSRPFSLAHLPAAGGFIPPGIPGHSPDLALPYDPERARRLLAEAGYPGGAGLSPVAFLHTHGLADQSMITFLQREWERNLGVAVEVTILPWDSFQARLHEDPPELMLGGWLADYPDPDNFLRAVFHSWEGLNEPHWCNERFDALVDEATSTTDPVQRMALYRQADQILVAEQAVVLPLSYGRGVTLRKPWVEHTAGPGAISRHLKDLIVKQR